MTNAEARKLCDDARACADRLLNEGDGMAHQAIMSLVEYVDRLGQEDVMDAPKCKLCDAGVPIERGFHVTEWFEGHQVASVLCEKLRAGTRYVTFAGGVVVGLLAGLGGLVALMAWLFLTA